jgi:hypothetical protein
MPQTSASSNAANVDPNQLLAKRAASAYGNTGNRRNLNVNKGGLISATGGG